MSVCVSVCTHVCVKNGNSGLSCTSVVEQLPHTIQLYVCVCVRLYTSPLNTVSTVLVLFQLYIASLAIAVLQGRSPFCVT